MRTIKETNIKSNEKYLSTSYQVGELVKNTDEVGMVEYFLNHNGTIWNYPADVMDCLFKALEPKEPENEIIEVKESSVSEDFALKMLSIVHNKENYKELK